jgi:hypothetical protein
VAVEFSFFSDVGFFIEGMRREEVGLEIVTPKSSKNL